MHKRRLIEAKNAPINAPIICPPPPTATPLPRREPDAVIVDERTGEDREKPKKFYSIPERGSPSYDPDFPEKTRKKYPRSHFCKQIPDSGIWCNGIQGDPPPLILRWYYNPMSKSCECLYYNGCDGNGNNFKSRGQCMNQCSGKYNNVANFVATTFIANFEAQPKTICVYFP